MTRLAVAVFSLATLAGATAHAETVELGTRLKGAKQVQRRLDFLVANPAVSEQKLGKGMRIVSLGKQTIANQDYYDTKDGTLSKANTQLRVRTSASTLPSFSLKPSGKIAGGTQRIETSAVILKGDELGKGHAFGGGGGMLGSGAAALRDFAKRNDAGKSLDLVKTTVGGQRQRYAVEQDGKPVGTIDVENHFVKGAPHNVGVGKLEFFGESQHGHKVVDHLGLKKPAAQGMRKLLSAAKLRR